MTDPGPPPCVQQLRAELVRAAARRRQRGRPVLLGFGVVALAVASLLATSPAPARADVHVERRGDRLIVSLTDLEHRPEHIEGVLRGLGLDATVVAAPVGPSQVGRFVGTEDDAGLAPEVRRVGAGPASFAGFSVPLGWRGHLALQVGRPAGPGEPYAIFSDALAPGEPLACRALLGLPVAPVLDLLAGLDLDVLVRHDPGGAVVRAIHATGPDRVVVRLGPPSPTATSPACPA